MTWKIEKRVLDTVLEAAKSTYPKEFIGILSGKDKHIKELIVVPAVYGYTFSSYKPYLLPSDTSYLGTVHSHPSSNINPSDADKILFSKFGSIHLIVGYPFNYNKIAIYGKDASPKLIEVVES